MRRRATCLLVLAFALAAAGIAPSRARGDTTGASYADVLAHPDDLAVNLSYVRRLVGEARLDAASATLERLLLIYPDALDLRYSYMLVLFRLADYEGALAEIAELEARGLPPPLAVEVARYKTAIETQARRTRIDLSLAAGGRYDSNRSSASAASTGLLLGFVVPNTDHARPDAAGLFSFGLSVEHDLDEARTTRLYAVANASLVQQAELSAYSMQGGAGEAGVEFASDPWRLRIGGLVRAFRLDGQNFALETGATARLALAATDRLELFVDAEAVEQWFRPIPISLAAELRSGARVRAGGGAGYALSDRTQIALGLHGSRKTAEIDPYAFKAADADLAIQQLFDGGQYARLDGQAWLTRYDAPDIIYSPSLVRLDKGFKLRASYGVPVGTLGAWLGAPAPAAIAPLTLQLAIDYLKQVSNVPNFSYANWGAEAMLIHRVSF